MKKETVEQNSIKQGHHYDQKKNLGIVKGVFGMGVGDGGTPIQELTENGEWVGK